MTETLTALIEEAKTTGTLKGLPTQLFIDGEWRAAKSGHRLGVEDPGRAEIFAEVESAGAEDVSDAVSSASRAFRTWREVPAARRTAILLAAADAVRRNADRLAVVEVLESGKPLSDAKGQIASCARALEYYAGAADKLEGQTIPLDKDHFAFTVNEPVGVSAHVVPWNYPASTAMRGIAPALAAGCVCVLKPAEETPLTALMFGEILRQAGLPAGVLNVVPGGRETGAALVADPRVRHVTFTGSVETGKRVMEAASRNVASVTMELGGKSPLVVLSDCDLDRAADDAIGAIFSHAGQVCSAGSRLIVERAVHEALIERLLDRVKTLEPRHGLEDPAFGPVVSERQLARIEGFVDAARGRGRTILCGGRRTTDTATGKGWFFEPTIVDDLPAEDPIVAEEVFGPVLAVQVVEDFEAAIAAANASRYGLVAGIQTKDFSKAMRFAREVEAGQVYINEFYAGGIEVPFGGVKDSGFGREKGLEALKSYLQVKSVAARI
ncbi:aldehyde dehydrogenase family protein [Aurantimonas sp. VKM B-3413]|uniref:aldehyde dehydrogenase family protein n=1 Tax=Aurantimonas sp. VKM B-3413 TaxID=2779401 RepID=UPI001E65962A|nr:aldehyde dehydrogenase family protein [Aurantimonas sp. VKM B-3413]MCB8838595.1 aldehyde dehydrogenase family protein [Aurantimonas sp. VKM B-3413]